MIDTPHNRSNDLRLAGAFALAVLAVSVIVGWLLKSPAMVEVLPDSDSTPMAVAIGMLLMALRHWMPHRTLRLRRIGRGVCGAVAVIGAVAIAQCALNRNLGLDFPSLHSWLLDDSPTPGRVPLLAAIGLLLAGSIGMADRLRVSAMRARLLLVGIFLLFSVGVVACALNWLDLAIVYDWPGYVNTSLPASVGLVMMAMLAALQRHRYDTVQTSITSQDSRDSERHILLVGAGLVALAALTAGLAGIASQQRALGTTLASGLQTSLTSRVVLFKSILDSTSVLAAHVARAPSVVDAIREFNAPPAKGEFEDTSAAARARLFETLQRMVDNGNSSAAIFLPDGSLLSSAGRAVDASRITAAVDTSVPSELIWQGALHLRTRVAVMDGNEVLAALVLEKNMDSLANEFFTVTGFGTTGVMSLCIAEGDGRLCFPGSGHEAPYRTSTVGTDLTRSAMGRALNGAHGVAPLRDYRGHGVIAAYSPFAPGLGAVLKQDTSEIYVPVRQALQMAIPMLLVFVLIGVGSLRWQLRPLLRKLGDALRFASEQELRIRTLTQHITDGMLTMDTEGVIRNCNDAACHLFGYAPADMVGKPLSDLVPLHFRLAFPQVLPLLIHGEQSKVIGSGAVELTGVNAQGDEFPIEVTMSSINLQDGRVLVGIVRCITARKEVEAHLNHQARHDSLTGLANRREFEARIESVLADWSPSEAAMSTDGEFEHALLFMDLDQFKIVNDTCGHLAGDELLRRLTAALKGVLRTSDLLARLGGDEFALLLERCGRQPALRIAETVRAAVSDFQFVWNDRSFRVGVSIGVVCFGKTETTRIDLVRAADAACYLAKERGRNRVEIHDVDSLELARRAGEMNWVSRLQHALSEDMFVLYRQLMVPVQPDAQQPARYELLVRLREKDGTLVPPMAFIPAAERYGLMPAIDRWVVRKALASMQVRHGSSELPTHYSINLSGASINDASMPAFLVDALASSGIDPHRVCFEVTETAAIASLEVASKTMQTLRDLGCQFALDDFGAGMSSFAYLRQLPVDYLKIDGRFVKGIVDDAVDLAMVEAVHNIGHRLGLKTVAEFVEDDRVMEKLREIGVDLAQGYFIGRPEPMPGGDVAPLALASAVDVKSGIVETVN